MLYSLLRPLLFALPEETSHELTLASLRSGLGKLYPACVPAKPVTVMGLDFPNPVGLAAGLDKNGDCIRGMAELGFGFLEVGTVTPRPQPGNPKPRLFRLPEAGALINRMGFNNHGVEALLRAVDGSRYDGILGINIGKNKLTTEDEALNDYEILFQAFKDYGDYIVINISSPNTPGLRDLQNENFIKAIFKMGQEITSQPILLKIAPDMKAEDAIVLCKTAVDAGAAGIIATNTTIDYSLTEHAKDFGGISGALLTEKSYELFRAIGKELYGKTLLISVGGIDSAEEAYKRIKAGASLVQVYSMLVYRGPALIKEINEGLIALLKKDGYSHISEAIGADWK